MGAVAKASLRRVKAERASGDRDRVLGCPLRAEVRGALMRL